MKHVLKNEIHNQSYSAATLSTFLHNLVMQYTFPYIKSLHVFKITSAFYLGFVTKKFKWRFLISNVSVGNIASRPWTTAIAGFFHTEKPVILGGTVKKCNSLDDLASGVCTHLV